VLPEVTLRVGEWADLPPASIRPRVWDAIAAMADRMAGWVEAEFRVDTEEDLDAYTYAVAGAVGVLLSDLWAWYDGTQTDRVEATAFGRGLQAVNILRNRDEDLAEGVDFFPDGASVDRMQAYARRQLEVADRYTDSLPPGPIREFCVLPLALAHATLTALEEGREKLTRAEVIAVVQQALAGAT
ncbi:MAG: squalene/phytoene synthase family protein, partial [Planctomycetota bacterium JB042]